MQLCSRDSLFVAGKGQLGLQSRPCGSGAQPRAVLWGCEGLQGAGGAGGGSAHNPPCHFLGHSFGSGFHPHHLWLSRALLSPHHCPHHCVSPGLSAHRSPSQRNPQRGFGDMRPNSPAVTQGQPHPQHWCNWGEARARRLLLGACAGKQQLSPLWRIQLSSY